MFIKHLTQSLVPGKLSLATFVTRVDKHLDKQGFPKQNLVEDACLAPGSQRYKKNKFHNSQW